jgi:phage terminase large subunit-like protein
LNEEPPLDTSSEELARTNATGGITIATFTLLLGMSDVVLRFLSADKVNSMDEGKGLASSCLRSHCRASTYWMML